MNKKTLLIIFILFDLSIIAAYFLFFRKSGTINKTETEFSIKDTSSINKIVITENDESVILEKIENIWKINNSTNARNENIKTMLNTLFLMELKSPIPDNAQDFITETLLNSKRVDVYTNNEIIKSYYIGTQTSEKNANYMMLENSENAYIVQIPSLNADISESFPSDSKVWKGNIIFSYNFDEISEIQLIYNEKPENSFRIIKSENDFKVFDYNENLIENINSENITKYFSYFSEIKFENYIENTNIEELKKNKPFIIVKITDSENNVNLFQGFYIFEKGTKNINKFSGILNENEIVDVKFYDFDLILKTLDYFRN